MLDAAIAPLPSRLTLLALAAAALLGGAAGCDWVTGPSEPGGAPPEITALPRALSAEEVEVIAANNAFGFDLLREVAAEDPEGSVFISPFSASMALGMALNGAEGETFVALRDVLGFEGLSEEEVNKSYQGLLDLLLGLDPDVSVTIGNSVWYRNTLELQAGFRDRVETAFDAHVAGLDFDRDESVDVINDWVSDVTRGMIDRMVEPPIEPEELAFLINAVHFDASWRARFDPARTEELPFHLPDGSTAPAHFMVREDVVQYGSAQRFHAVDLPYGGGAWSMTVVVPRGEATLAEVVEEIDAATWAEFISGFRDRDMHVYLPRFEMEWGGPLDPALDSLGMGVVFDKQRADFTRMFNAPWLEYIWISGVNQRARVRVDEKGTEAVAATAVVVSGITGVRGPAEFRADRPFLFAIRERLSGTVVFLGLVVEPPVL